MDGTGEHGLVLDRTCAASADDPGGEFAQKANPSQEIGQRDAWQGVQRDHLRRVRRWLDG